MRYLLAVLLWSALASAQVVGPGFVNYVTSAPSGSCSQGEPQRNVMGSGNIYTCASGTWTQIGSGAGSVTSVSFTGGLISVATPTTTPALTVAGTSGGIPYFSGAATWASSGALTQNVLIKGGGAGVSPAVSLATDDGTTLTYSGTGGLSTPGAVTSGTGSAVAGAWHCGQGTDPGVGAVNTITDTCPTAVTAYENIRPGTAANGLLVGTVGSSKVTQGYSGDANHSTVVSISTATSIGSTSLCSTTFCPAGTYRITAFVDVTTACSTTGSYIVSAIFTDDTTVSKTVVMPLNGTGTTFSAAGAGATTSSLAMAATTNYAQGTIIVHSTGAASINYSTTAGACGSGGPGLGKLYLSVEPLS